MPIAVAVCLALRPRRRRIARTAAARIPLWAALSGCEGNIQPPPPIELQSRRKT